MGLLNLAGNADIAAEAPLQAIPRTAGERIEATAGEVFSPDRYFTITAARRSMWQRAIDELHGATGQSFANPYGAMTAEEMQRLGNQPAVVEERRNRIIEAAQLARAYGNDDLFNPENIDRYIAEEASRRRQRAAAYEGTGNGVINFLAGAAMSSIEPVNVLALALPVTRLPLAASSAVGRTFLGNVTREAAFQAGANVGTQGVSELLDYTTRREVGTEPSAGEIAGNLAGAATIGAILGGGVRALHLKWLGLPAPVRAAAPTEVKDAFRVLESEAIYGGSNRLGIDPLLHERYQGRALDAVMRGTPVTLEDLARTQETPLTALGTILRVEPRAIRPDIIGLGNVLGRIQALPDSELEAVLREARPQLFATLDDIGRRSVALDAREAGIRQEMAQIGPSDLVDIDTGARLADIENRLQARGLRRAERLDLERERDMIMESVDRSGLLPQELAKTRAEFFPDQMAALRDIGQEREAISRETVAARSALQREIEQLRNRLGTLQVGRQFAEEVPAEVLARELGPVPDLAAAVQRADMLRRAAIVREVMPEGPLVAAETATRVVRGPAAQGVPEPTLVEQARALKAEAARLVEARPDTIVQVGGIEMAADKALEEAERMEREAQVALGCAMGSL